MLASHLIRISLCLTTIFFVSLSFAINSFAQYGDDTENFWVDSSAETKAAFDRNTAATDDRLLSIEGETFSIWRLNGVALKNHLSNAPMEFSEAAKDNKLILSLPLPNGKFSRFNVVESPIFSPELATQYPDIKTYKGFGIDDSTATVRFDITTSGFHAMLSTQDGTIFLDPQSSQKLDNIVAYNKKDYFRADANEFSCSVGEETHEISTDESIIESIPQPPNRPERLRTYRLAMGVTWGYVQFQSGLGTTAANAIATTVNRNNVIYERDLAIRLIISATVIPTSASNDPYVNSDGTPMTGNEAWEANPEIMDSRVGSGNYDIGHVMGTNGSGGKGDIAQVCDSGNIFTQGRKGKGMTFRSNPIGDSFDVDYVAHEIGHQFGGHHTWNAINSGSCVAGGRSDIASYEIGSGTTIMAYAGICGSADLQQNSDSYFHAKSTEQILTTTTTGSCNCGQQIGGVNALPSVEAGSSYNVPAYTPFTLTATGSDPDGQALTYSWQQSNLGDPNPPYGDNGNRPLFRAPAGLPATNPSRTFPRIDFVLNNDNTPTDNYTASNGNLYLTGEVMPFINQMMDFTVTARDNAGGVALDSTSIYITNTGSSFKVLEPDGGEVWHSGTNKLIQWRVADTDVAPINATHVNILFSVDGGNNFSTILANTPNDGTEQLFLAAQSTQYNNVRIKIEAAGNIFFDVSNADFILLPSYTVSGRVQKRSGQPEAGVVMTIDATGATAVTDSSGNFSIRVPGNNSYTITPSRSGTSFSPASLTLPVLIGNYTIPEPFYTNNSVQISGRLRDQDSNNLADITVDLNGGEQTAVTNSNGIYTFDNVLEGANYTVSPLSSSYQFTPLNHAITNLSGNTTVPDFTGRSLLHKLSGVVTNRDTSLPMQNVIVALTGTESRTTTTDSAGYYEFTNLRESGNYTLTPSFGFWEFYPASKVFNGLPGDATQNFQGIAPPKIIGKIIDVCGDAAGGIEVKAVPSNSTAYTDGDGRFEISVPRGGSYTVTPSEAGWSFVPVSRPANNVVADVTIDDFIGTPPTVEYFWSGIAANSGPLYDKSWSNSNNWTVIGQPAVNYPRCVDYANVFGADTIDLRGSDKPNGQRVVKRLIFSGGSVENGALTVTERMDWYGASAANNSAYLRNTNLTIPSNAELRLLGSYSKGIEGGVLKNQGTVVWTGDYFNLAPSSTESVCRFDNEGTLRLESTTDHQLFLNGAPTCFFNNKPGAIITKPVVANYAPNTIFQQNSGFSNATLVNESKIITSAGRLIVLGSAEFKNGTRFEGAGVTLLNGATKKFSGQAVIASGATLETGTGGLDGYLYGDGYIEGTPSGSFNTEGTGTFLVGSSTFFDGTINLNGKTDIEITTGFPNPGISLENSNNGTDTINNNGTINWRGNQLYLGSSVFNNSGTLNIICDEIFNSQGSIANIGSVFNNQATGVIRKSGAGGATDFMNYPFLSQFHNHGLVDVQSGTMLIHNGTSSGTFRTAQNAIIEIQQNELYTFLGTNLETNGVFRNNGGLMDGSFRGTLQMLSGGVVNNLTALAPTPTLAAGTFDWRGGFIGSNNQFPNQVNVTIQTGAAMLIDATDAATWSGAFGNATVTNHGAVQWTGQENTSIGVGDGGTGNGLTFNNNGTFFLESDGTLFRHGDNSDFIFNNNAAGVFKKSGGSGAAYLDIFGHKFINRGTIEIASGVIQSGGVEFEFKNNSRIKSSGGKLSLNNLGSTSEANGSVVLEGTGDSNNYVLELGGDSNGATLEGSSLTLVSDNNAGFLWTGGAIKGSVIFGSGLRTKIQPAGNANIVTLDGTLSNAGTIDWENGMDWGIGTSGDSTFTNLNGAIFNHRTTGAINNQSGYSMNFVNAGTLNIGQSTGAFNMNPFTASPINFVNQPTAIINMDITDAADFDKITAPNYLTLGGKLNVNFINGFVPNVGDEFKLFEGATSGAARQGAFAQVSLPSIGGKSLRLKYNDDDLIVETDALYVWDGSASGDWNDPENWAGGEVPPTDALVEIPDAANEPDLSDTSVTIDNLNVQNGQEIIVGGGNTLTVNGVLNLDGGTIDTTGESARNRIKRNLKSQIVNSKSNDGSVLAGLLAVGANSAINRTGGAVIGDVKKTFGGAGSFIFPVGTANGYSPLDVTVTAGAGDLTVKANQSARSPLDVLKSLNRFWTLNGSGITANLTFNYLDADVFGNENVYQIVKLNGTTSTFYAHNPPNVLIDPTNNQATINGVSSFSDWTLAEPLAPTAAFVTIGGRVTEVVGKPIFNARVTITNQEGETRSVLTSPNGRYVFDQIEAGKTYVVSVESRWREFGTPTQIIFVAEERGDINFIALP